MDAASKLGTKERIAPLDGHWRDTLLLERRSREVGILFSQRRSAGAQCILSLLMWFNLQD